MTDDDDDGIEARLALLRREMQRRHGADDDADVPSPEEEAPMSFADAARALDQRINARLAEPASPASPPTEAAAWEQRRALEEERDALPDHHPRRDELTRKVLKILETVPVTPTPRPTATVPPTFSLAQQLDAAGEIRRLRHEQESYPEGHPVRDRINERVLELTLIAHAAEIAARQGQDTLTITERDADRIARDLGMPETARLRFASVGDALGATPLERTQFLTAIRAYDGRTPPEPNDLDLAELWGADADRNVAAARRVKAAVTPEDWRQHVAPWLGVPAVVNLLAALGRRLSR